MNWSSGISLGTLYLFISIRVRKDEQWGGRERSRQKLTKSLCKSLLRCGDIFIAPMNTKNNPNRIDKLFSTTDELTLFWAIVPVGGGWAFCEFGEVVIVQLVLSLAVLLFFSLFSRVPQLNLSRFINETLDRLKRFNWFTFSHNWKISRYSVDSISMRFWFISENHSFTWHTSVIIMITQS